MTNTSALPAPPDLLTWLAARNRDDCVLDHGARVDLDWWNTRTDGLPGSPVTSESGEREGRGRITRRQLFALGDAAVADHTGQEALRLLWHALAWGSGLKSGRRSGAITSIREHPEHHARLLHEAAEAARTDPAAAFSLLQPRPRWNTVKGLGPNFFTKLLYFAGGGRTDHPALIVDQFVRVTAYDETGRVDPSLAHLSQYPVGHYLATLEVIAAWTADASARAGRAVAADEVERWAFEAGKSGRRRRPGGDESRA